MYKNTKIFKLIFLIERDSLSIVNYLGYNKAVYLSIRMVSKWVKNQADVKLGVAQHCLC